MNTEETMLRVSNGWHALPPDEVTTRCGSDGQSGLSASEAERRLKQYGPNVITARRGKSPLVRFLLQFHNPLLYILLLASIITFVLKDPVDAAILAQCWSTSSSATFRRVAQRRPSKRWRAL